MRNPVSQNPVKFEVTTFHSIKKLSSGSLPELNGLIDTGDAMFLPQQSAFIHDAIIRADVSTVQEYSKFYLSFKAPVPVNQGCVVTIQLPDEFVLESVRLNEVIGWGIFGQKRPLTFGLDEKDRIIKIVDQCTVYSNANTTADLELDLLQNPYNVKPTKSFFIKVTDGRNKGVAEIFQGMVYFPKAGVISNVRLYTLGGDDIQEVVNIRLDFTPPHELKGLTTALKLKMPPQMTFTCLFAYTIGLKTAPDCKLDGFNELRLPNPFNRDLYEGNIPLSIAFRSQTLPISDVMIQGITIQMVQVYEDTDYVIDEFVDENIEFFAAEAQLFADFVLSTESEEVYTETVFSFKAKVRNTIPSDAIIGIVLPSQIEIADKATAENSCTSGFNLAAEIRCEVEPIEKDGVVVSHKLWAYDAFSDGGLLRDDEFEFKVLAGIYTSISMQTSESLQFIIYDQGLNRINFKDEGIPLAMKRAKDIGPVQLVPGSSVVGAITDHTLIFKTPAPVSKDQLIMIHIPDEVTAPSEKEFVCKLSKPLSHKHSQCSINGQRISITVAIDDEYPGGRIPAGTELEINFRDVKNPSSTQPSEPYRIEIQTENYQVVAEQLSGGALVINQAPAVITQVSFEALDLRQLVTTTITIEWENTQTYPQGLAIKLFTDLDEIMPIFENPDEDNSVPCVFRQTVRRQCEYLQDEPGVIKVTGLLQGEQTPGSSMSLTLSSQNIIVEKTKATNSWTLVTYTDSNTLYAIDRAANELQFDFKCNLPCLTCKPDDPDYCLSCNQHTSQYLMHFDGKCGPSCPPVAYMFGLDCFACDQRCKTCEQNNGARCTTCRGGYLEFPFLYGFTCVEECIYGFFGDRDDAVCKTCVDPCETCVDQPDKCLSCKMPPPGEPIHQFYFEHQCLLECPQGYVANESIRSNVCNACNDNCLTCFGNVDQCATCEPGMRLSLIDYTCVFECPEGISVPATDPDIGLICEPCDSSCVTCSGLPDFCTSCQKNLSLKPAEGICQLDCDENNNKQVSVNGNCVGCSSSCKTCQYTPDTCMSCYDDKYFYGASCVTKCPKKAGYQYEPNPEGICIIPGIRCDFGYELAPTGDYCLLKAQICLAPNELNYDKTTCVPGSDSFIPYPLLICCGIFTVFSLISKIVKPRSHFFATMLAFWSIIETVGVLVVLHLAVGYGIKPVVNMILVSLMLSIATNIFFFIVYQRQIMKDLHFFHWAQYYKWTQRIISGFALVFNFKVYCLLYSKFFGSKRFDAPFADPYKFFTPLSLASWINLLLVMLLSLVGSTFGLYYVSWGYQLAVECFELIIIEICMILLYAIEYCQIRAQGVMKRTPNWKVDANQVDKLKVKSGYMDELSDDGQDQDALMVQWTPKSVRREAKPKALKTIHTMEKVLAQLLVKKKSIKGGYANTMQEIELLHERELMLRYRRRCMSFRIDRPDFRTAWGFKKNEVDECEQNFISEPGSPRSKEMLQNKNFSRRMQALSRAYHMRDQFDNVYAEARDPSVWVLRDVATANKYLQTNVMELLGVDDLRADTQSQVTEPANDDYEYDPQHTTASIIANVIARIDHTDHEDEGQHYNTKDSFLPRRSDSDKPKTSTTGPGRGSRQAGPPPKPKRPKRKRKQLTKRRQSEMPNFIVDEILGEFEPDDEGNQIILQTANGKLSDKYGRAVNRRGYLIDPAGNVITRGNVFIFYQEEMDFDDEIPAPYCFKKPELRGKYTVRNLNQHRKIRQKDKLAMQDEYVEREYQKLRQAARRQGVASDTVSQQYSPRIDFGKVHKTDRAPIHGRRASSKASHHLGNASGVALIQQSDSSHLGDVNISHMILQDREGGDYPHTDELTADAFQAMNSTVVKRRPPKQPSTGRNSTDNSRKKLDEDPDNLLDDVTEPMRAKTKSELLGAGVGSGATSRGGLQTTRSNRSRSGSIDKRSDHSSVNKPQYQIKEGKMLNISSHRSFDKREVETQEQFASQADLMAMPTAGAEEIDTNQPKNMDFVTKKSKKLLNMSSSTQMNAKARSGRGSNTHSRGTSRTNQPPLHPIDLQNMNNDLKQSKVNDQEFIEQVHKVNELLQQRKDNLLKQAPQHHGKIQRVATAGLIDDTFLNADGSVRSIGLAHKNLNQVYGRVRAKFNEQIRSGSHALRHFRPQGKSYKNRIDEPSRIIAGMSQNQRERMLQLEINHLMEAGNDNDLSLDSVRRRLSKPDSDYYNANSSFSQSFKRGADNGSCTKRQRQEILNEKVQALSSIYSGKKLNYSGSQRKSGMVGLSPHHPNNQITFDASRILDFSDTAVLPNREQLMDDLIKTKERAAEVRHQIENLEHGSECKARSSKPSSRTVNSNPGAISTSGFKRANKPPSGILDGKFL